MANSACEGSSFLVCGASPLIADLKETTKYLWNVPLLAVSNFLSHHLGARAD